MWTVPRQSRSMVSMTRLLLMLPAMLGEVAVITQLLVEVEEVKVSKILLKLALDKKVILTVFHHL